MSSNKVMIYVKIICEPNAEENNPTSKIKRLNPDSNLSDIRKELKKSINDMNILLFAKKLKNLPNEFVEMDRVDEEETLLKEIIFDDSENKFLYLMKNSGLCWNY